MSILLGQALRAARKQRGLTQAQVAERLGISPPAVGQWESGETEPATENLIKVCSVLGLDLQAATGGMVRLVANPLDAGGPMVVEDRRPEFRGVEDELIRGYGSLSEARASLRDVPVHGVAAAGADADFFTNGEIIDYVRRPAGLLRAKEIYALYVVGTSMEPRYEEGELIYVNPSRPPAIGDYVVVELIPEPGDRAGRGYVKRLARRTAAKLYLDQFNPPKTLEFQTNKVNKLHRVMPWNEVLGV